jgi:phosphopentomutase
VAAFATWSAFRRIINTERSKVPVFDGWDHAVAPTGTARAASLREVMATNTRMWPDNTWDAFTHVATLDYQQVKKPRVLFIGYGETDEWAHAGRYDLYLQSAHQVDAYLAQLWQQAQANPVTRDKTTLIVTTDHGRGNGAKWTDHGQDVIGAERIWMAVMGPDVAGLGVRRNVPSTQSQIAATIAAALGLDWRKAEPRAAAALPVFGK